MSKTAYRATARLALGGLIAAIWCGAALAKDAFAPCSDVALPGLAGSLCAVSPVPLRPNDPEAGTAANMTPAETR